MKRLVFWRSNQESGNTNGVVSWESLCYDGGSVGKAFVESFDFKVGTKLNFFGPLEVIKTALKQ